MTAIGIPTNARLGVLAWLAIALPWPAPFAHAGGAEVPKEVVAVQIRKQGFECKNPQSAERDQSAEPDQNVWILTCENARYRVNLIPRMAAKVKKLPEEETETEAENAPAPAE